MQKAP